MAIETDADRAVFLDDEDFGVELAWPYTSAGRINGIFDESFLSLQAGDLEFSQEGARPQVLLRSSDIPSGAANGDRIRVYLAGGAVDFRVLEKQPDGTGMTTVRLEEL